MKYLKANYYIISFFYLFVFQSCNFQEKEKTVTVNLQKHINLNLLELCIKIMNNTNDNVYIVSDSWFLTATKEYKGIKEDAIIDIYNAQYNSNNWNFNDDNFCEKIYRGPLHENKEFKENVVKELFKFISPNYRKFISNHYDKRFSLNRKKWNSDTNTIDNVIHESIYINMNCLFIPKGKEISISIKLDLNKIKFDKLFVQFVYPNNNMYKYYKMTETSPSLRILDQLDSCTINYPNKIMDYKLYMDSIKSEIIEIVNQK